MSRRWVLRHTPGRVVLVGPVVACCVWLAAAGVRRSLLGARGRVCVGASAFFGGYGWQVLRRAYRRACT